jgi:hypothetical protein
MFTVTFDKHGALFEAIRDNIYNNIGFKYRNALQIKSMQQFDADWLEDLVGCLDDWPHRHRHSQIFKFGIGFYKPGEIRLLLDVSSKKGQAFSPEFSDLRKELAELVSGELFEVSRELCRVTSVIFQDEEKNFKEEVLV